MRDYTPQMLAALNSATKYPSIETYHRLADKGLLVEEPNVATWHGDLYVTEKVDGTNARLVFDPSGDRFIGSREELLTHLYDVVRNTKLGIVDTLLTILDEVIRREEFFPDDHLTVIYVEVFGGRQLPAWKQYGDGSQSAWRMFDACVVPLEVLSWPTDKVALWREHGGQSWYGEKTFQQLANAIGAPIVPRIQPIAGGEHWTSDDLPIGLHEMYELMLGLGDTTRVGLGGYTGGRCEGYVIRNADRTQITKARFEDYERTFKAAATRRVQAVR